MRNTGLAAAAVFIFILVISGPSSVWAQETKTGKILILQRGADTVAVVGEQETAAPTSGVTVVRGPATPPRSGLPDPDYHDYGGYLPAAVAGDTLWLLDPVKGEIIACTAIDSANFREIEMPCWKRDLPY